MDLTFIGEHLLPGQIGHALIILSFIASILAFISFTKSSFLEKKGLIESDSWKKLGRISFYTHIVAVFGIGISLFYIIYNQYFEYHYAWQHSSKILPTHYIISCFWEGQEGSFWLWTVWHAVLGFVLIRTAKTWESPVLSIVSLAQVALSSMILGVYFFGYKLGSNPFMLLREVMQAPIFSRPNYLEFITDGNGLNPLLQNPWMVIHPPVLFLGFASTLIPFAFLCAVLFKQEYKSWMEKVLPWTLFSLMILGLGVMMGGAWAYESLSFGGYWAWDPVENASLVPWLLLLGGLHTLLVYKKTGQSSKSTFLMLMSGFILVLYATFLTRSGILGDSSVHAFTDLGMSGQLLVYLFIFVAIAGWLLYSRWDEIPMSKSEAHLTSREFWMFFGALVLLISCFHITFVTSIPVWNKLFGTKLAPPADAEAHYNRFQLPIAVLILLLTGFAQIAKFKLSAFKDVFVKSRIALILSLTFALIIGYYNEFQNWQYSLLLFSAFFGLIINAQILQERSKKLPSLGSTLSHIGFAIMLVGILISSVQKEVISINRTGLAHDEAFKEKDNEENVLLWKNEPIEMKGFRVTFLGDSAVEPNIFYKVQYEKINPDTKKVDYSFVLTPNAQLNPKMGLIANPDTKHFLQYDLFTHVTKVPDKKAISEAPEWRDAQEAQFDLTKPDTVMLSEILLINEGVTRDLPADLQSKTTGSQLAVALSMRVKRLIGDTILKPVYVIKDNTVFTYDAIDNDAGLRIWINKIDPKTGKVSVSIAERTPKPRDYIIMKAIRFPYINLVWLGMITMVIGLGLAMIYRKKEFKRLQHD